MGECVMPDKRAYRLKLRDAAANFRRLSEQHGEGGNPEISRKLANVADALDAEAKDIEVMESCSISE
jgi:hypothetical protein